MRNDMHGRYARRQRKKRHTGKLLSLILVLGCCVTGAILLNPAAPKDSHTVAAFAQTPITTQAPITTKEPSVYSPIQSKLQALENADQATQQDWQLTLVNCNNPIPEGYMPELTDMGNEFYVDSRIAAPLREMLNAAKAEGLYPIICSGYRSVEMQQRLYDKQVQKWIDFGYNRDEAERVAGTVVAYPGTSEHNLGLAVDIVALDYQLLDEAQAKTPEMIWLTAHCCEYGFILRYPENKSDLTLIIYEPWHFRYVGVDAAKEIMEQGLCLEEYV